MNSGINGNLLDLIDSLLHNRRRLTCCSTTDVVGQSSDCKFVKAGVPQGSVL